jgi:serine/threonine protein kinase
LIENRYRLEREIGVGGMGVVWLATDVTLDRQVAMKRAHAISTNRGDTTKLQVEAGLATRVRHPNIVEVYGVVGEADDQWLIMEYVPGRSLAEIIAVEQVLSVPRAIHYIRQIADALDAVHRAEVVHGDVKPANILIPDNGVAKLSDFGVSRQVWNAETLNTTGPVVGTPAYMAPELLDGKRPAPASDLFALGATLFAAVEGETPYGSDGAPLSMVKRMVHNDMVPMHNAGSLAPLLASMLATEPAERPTAAGASRLLRELGGTIDPVKETDPGKPDRRRRRQLVGLALVVLLVAVLGVVGWLAWPKSDSSVANTPTTSQPPNPAGGEDAADTGLTLANQTLVNPCGLMNADVLAKFGTNVGLDPHFGNFDRCDVLFETNNTTIDVQVDLDDPDGPPTGKSTVVVQAPQIAPNDCERTVLLPDGTQIAVDAAVQNGDDPPTGTVDFCGIDEVATQFALGVLGTSGVPQRAPGALTGSLANYNACTLLTPAQLAVVAGIASGSPQPRFGDWVCEWDGPDNLKVTVTFDQSQPLDSSDGQQVAVGSRAAYVSLDTGGCEADLVYRTINVSGGNQISELVNIEVDGNQPQSQQCGLAQVLAQDVNTKLH